MSLPKRHLKSTQGQILILFLLVLVVGMAIVLSVASRTVTDIRTTATSDESNRAYYAAESGIEEALQKLQQPGGTIPAGGFKTDFQTTVNAQATTADVTSTAAAAGPIDTFVYPENVEKDDVAQIMLVSDIPPANGVIDVSDIIGGGAWTGRHLTIFWGSNSSTTNQAVEVSVVYYCPAVCPGFSGNFGITKFGFDPDNVVHNNNFCNLGHGVTPISGGQQVSDPISSIAKQVFFRADLDLRGTPPVTGCASGNQGSGIGVVGSTVPVLLRIRALYNSEPMPIAVGTIDVPPGLPIQGNVIESTGYTSSGVTRKLQVIRLYPTLPALFDYVLFSGSDLSK